MITQNHAHTSAHNDHAIASAQHECQAQQSDHHLVQQYGRRTQSSLIGAQ